MNNNDNMTADKSAPQCKHCSKEFKYESERKRHEKSHFPQFTCKICSKNFSFISALRRHEKQHERNGSVHCNICARTFRDSTLLKRHVSYAHGDESFLCTKCDAKFNSYTAFNTHLKTHKANSERQYRCKFMGCKKAFNFSHHLKHHELTHTNTKQHFCSVCNKGFIQSHHLKAHLKTHDSNSSVCCSFPECKREFATVYSRKRHEAKHHSTISDDLSLASDVSLNSDFASDFSVKINFGDEAEIDASHKLYTCIQDIKPEDLSIHRMVDDAVSNDFNDCKAVIGNCITTTGQDCVCEQMPNISTEDITKELEFAPIDYKYESNRANYSTDEKENKDETDLGRANLETSNKLSIDDIKFDNPCDGCECANHCNVIDIINSGAMDVKPNIEYNNGALKLKDTFDIDMSPDTEKSVNTSHMKFAPYSCKAVLGNCIVSGNGTIDEQCLCARMTVDEPATSQEIEDITPHPNE